MAKPALTRAAVRGAPQAGTPRGGEEPKIPSPRLVSNIVLPVVALVVLLAVGIGGGRAVDLPPCQSTAADIQALRDNLEIINNQVLRARNEGGPEQQSAVHAVTAAVHALEEAVGHPITPSPASLIVVTPRSTKHPHMQVVHQAFGAAQRAFDNMRCGLPRSPEPLQKALADLERTLQFR